MPSRQRYTMTFLNHGSSSSDDLKRRFAWTVPLLGIVREHLKELMYCQLTRKRDTCRNHDFSEALSRGETRWFAELIRESGTQLFQMVGEHV